MKFKDLLNQEQLNSYKASVSKEDKDLFASAIGKVKKLNQDTIQAYQAPVQASTRTKANKATEKQKAQFHFSDEYEPYLSETGPVKYVRADVDSFLAKQLRRGDYQPDLILDLHGLDQQQAKNEIAALLYACQKEHARCICIVHGLGGRILKNKVPHWLVQHPDIMAFHQAPLEWGGKGAILALVELKEADWQK